MALRKDIPTAPQSRPDQRHETVYKPSQGGHYRPEQKPVPGTPKDR